MAQFDVHRLGDGRYAIDCQSPLLSHLTSRFTVPLEPIEADGRNADRLHPEFEVEGRRVVMATHLAGAIPTRALGKTVTSLAAHEFEIKAALDMLISGF